MKKGDIVYGINQSGMIGEEIVKGILVRVETVTGYKFDSNEGNPCYELYTGPKDRTKSNSIFDYRLFNVEEVFTTYDEASKYYFFEKLAGRL